PTPPMGITPRARRRRRPQRMETRGPRASLPAPGECLCLWSLLSRRDECHARCGGCLSLIPLCSAHTHTHTHTHTHKHTHTHTHTHTQTYTHTLKHTHRWNHT